MKLTAYGLFAYFSLKESLVYWKNSLFQIGALLFRIVLQLSAWYALYKSVGFQDVMGRSFDTMMTYQLVVLVVVNFTNPTSVAASLEERMKSGEIATDFLRPVAPRGILIARSWGKKAFILLPQLIAGGIAALAIGGISLPASFSQSCLFVLSLVLGYLINLTFDLLLATFAFWFVAVDTLKWFVDFFQLAMSGAVVPLWLLPDWLQGISRFLPFQASVYIPMQIYLGQISHKELLQNFGLQLLWIALLFLLQQRLWKRGIHRLEVHGG